MLVALLLRRSTNEELQADSLIVQEDILRSYAGANGHTVVRLYRESASGRKLAGRDAFQRLLDDVRRGASFEAVLVRDVSRWGRFENPDESAFYEFFCLLHGVRVIYVEEPFQQETSPYAALMKSMKRIVAAEYSRERSAMVQASQARVVRLGFVHGGPAPFGLKRVLVNRDGSTLQDLQPGDRKVLSTTRVKLAPGDPSEIRVVERIFREYLAGRSLQEISTGLNADGTRGRSGGKWSAGSVSYIIRNPAYAGMVRYSRYNGDKRSALYNVRDDFTGDRVVRCESAHTAIIPRPVWDAAQARLKAQTWRKTNVDLARELRQALERWGFVAAGVVNGHDGACWGTYANRFARGYAEALELSCKETITAAVDAVRVLLTANFRVTEFGDGWLVNDVLHVKVKAAWPRAGRAGLHWEVQFTGDEEEDVTLGLAFAPTPTVRHVETFVFHTARHRNHRPHRVRPNVLTGSTRQCRRYAPTDNLRAPLEYAIRWRAVRTEARLLDAFRACTTVNLTAIAREGNWPKHLVERTYRRLRARGITLPPLKYQPGRRLTVVCPDCQSTRRLRPSDALALSTHVCIECQRRRFPQFLSKKS